MNGFDFSSMNVGDEVELPQRGPWESVRIVYDECQEYVRKLNPSPQFEFEAIAASSANLLSDALGKSVDESDQRWLIRRVR